MGLQQNKNILLIKMVHPNNSIKKNSCDLRNKNCEVSCQQAPFLPKCELTRTRGQRCQTGSFSITLNNGSVLFGKMWETVSLQARDKYYRHIEINNVTFQLKNATNTFNQELFSPLSDGEEFDANVVQPGAVGRFSLIREGALCRLGLLN